MINILFFDNEPLIGRCLIENLKSDCGWSCEKDITYVSDTRSVIKRINDDSVRYDLFVLDIFADFHFSDFTQEEVEELEGGMRTGYVLAKKIRMIERYKDVPILFFSAAHDNIPESMRTNTYYLQKPVFANELSEIMKEIIDRAANNLNPITFQ